MKNRSYTSFAEIDKDLQIAKLERDIHREKIFLQAEKLKSNFSLSGLLKNTMGGGEKSSSSSSIIMNIANMALPFIMNKFKK
jgi:hypothetical protein